MCDDYLGLRKALRRLAPLLGVQVQLAGIATFLTISGTVNPAAKRATQQRNQSTHQDRTMKVVLTNMWPLVCALEEENRMSAWMKPNK